MYRIKSKITAHFNYVVLFCKHEANLKRGANEITSERGKGLN
jgi:hypothetical protein